MNVQTIGVGKRPKLSLLYGRPHASGPEGLRRPNMEASKRAPALPARELRRIVADMIG